MFLREQENVLPPAPTSVRFFSGFGPPIRRHLTFILLGIHLFNLEGRGIKLFSKVSVYERHFVEPPFCGVLHREACADPQDVRGVKNVLRKENSQSYFKSIY